MLARSLGQRCETWIGDLRGTIRSYGSASGSVALAWTFGRGFLEPLASLGDQNEEAERQTRDELYK